MILVDTSVWAEHFRKEQPRLSSLLNSARVLCHPWIVGELACGHLKRRGEILRLLCSLPSALEATQEEVLGFIDKKNLAGSGIGWIDAHLLASVELSDSALWTMDKKLFRAASNLKIAYTPEPGLS